MRRTMRTLSQNGTALLIGTMSMVFVIPMLGLAIDAAYIYGLKTRLQSGVDGAALAAARALSLGENTASQADRARQNAVNWFYANLPEGNWATSNTMMDQSMVQVFDDPNNPSLRNVNVTASTLAPTWFMKWLGYENIELTATGNASRRDVVIMLLLDRSTSMNMAPGNACQAMKDAAKLFTGQFAPGRDRIGLVSYSDGTYLHSPPTTDFQHVLGYENSLGSATGAIDTVQCTGGTNSAQAISVAYNELYKTALPGALNLIMFETDGLPNSLTLRWWDEASQQGGFNNLGSSTGCRDNNSQTKGAGGWAAANSERNWIASDSDMNQGGTGFWPNIQAGTYGVLWTSDTTASFLALGNPWHPHGNAYGLPGDRLSTSQTPGCRFNGSMGNVTDFAWMPPTDVFGNELNPTGAYLPVTMSGGKVAFSGTTSSKWHNFRNAAFNATDHAARRARANPTLPVSMFVVGLGGYAQAPPDLTLLQRLANDPRGDAFNNPPAYQPCAATPGCVYHPDEPSGSLLYSTDQSFLRQAFLQLSSQILRLSE